MVEVRLLTGEKPNPLHAQEAVPETHKRLGAHVPSTISLSVLIGVYQGWKYFGQEATDLGRPEWDGASASSVASSAYLLNTDIENVSGLLRTTYLTFKILLVSNGSAWVEKD